MQEEIENYEKLYLIKGNTKTYIDYMILLDLYSRYLSLFVADQERYRDFAGNISFLTTVVNGFSYYQKSFIGEAEMSDINLFNYINNKFIELKEKALIKITNSSNDKDAESLIEDDIFKISVLCDNQIKDSNSLLNRTLSDKLFINSYHAEQTLKIIKKIKGM